MLQVLSYKFHKRLILLLGLIFGLFAFRQVEAASLYISPASGSFSLGSTFTVTVRTDTQGAAVNTAEANISFSTDTLELVTVTASQTFYLQAPGSPAKGNGTAYFGGGLPTPGYTGANGAVGSMTFRALREGTAIVSITAGKVLLNDGSGTDALSTTAGARYTITPPAVGTPEVSSPTHPDPEKWVNKNTVELSWSRPSGAHGFSFELDGEAGTIPDNVLDTTITTTQTYESLEDGVWYFHIKARRQQSGSAFGNTAHYRILIDITPPGPFEIRLVGQSDLNDVTRTPTIEFSATDATAGIDHYDIYVDDQFLITVAENQYIFSKLEPGPHIIKVTAYDRAGNTTSASLPIIVTGPAIAKRLDIFATKIQLPIIVVIVFALAIWFLLFLLLLLLLRRRRKQQPQIRASLKALQLEVDNSLERLKHQINAKLFKLLEKSSQDLYDEEQITARDIGKKIRKTRRKLDRRITQVEGRPEPRVIKVKPQKPPPRVTDGSSSNSVVT